MTGAATGSLLGLAHLGLTIAAVACGAPDDVAQRAELLVRRNLFDGRSSFAIEQARAFQYGDLHVDGLEGGMMYRFRTTQPALEWLIGRWSLREHRLAALARILPATVPEGPSWWRPDEVHRGAIYVATLRLNDGSERILVLVHDREAGDLFVVGHILAAGSV